VVGVEAFYPAVCQSREVWDGADSRDLFITYSLFTNDKDKKKPFFQGLDQTGLQSYPVTPA
jgi:hypothetical protein